MIKLQRMEWEDELKEKIADRVDLEVIHQLCTDAYNEGRDKERILAVEAYRLRCYHLFGNRCMNHSRSDTATQSVCSGNCSYIRQYQFELYKLEN